MALNASNARNQIAAALGLNRQMVKVNKASLGSQLAGGFTSLWLATGQPGAGAIPTTAAFCSKATVGAALFFNNAGAGNALYLAKSDLAVSNGGTTIETHDRCYNMGGLNGTLITAQTVNIDPLVIGGQPDRIGPTTGSTAFNLLEWWLEWYVATGATAAIATITYTNASAVTGRTTTVSIPANTALGRMIPIIGAGGEAIASIQSVTLNVSTGVAGNFGVTVTNRLAGHCGARAPSANFTDQQSWAELGLPLVGANACIQHIAYCATTSSGAVVGDQYIVEI